MKRGVLGLCLVASLAAPGRGQAQQIDYRQYEELFGEPVTVSATGKPERVSDSPVLMNLISAEDIRRSGAKDIPTLLRRLGGIDIKHSSQNGVDIGIGGYIQAMVSRVMVLINGRQVYFDGFGDVFWASLPVELEEIRQIEVIRGPQSALYGFNAVDGVINIVTFDPVDDRVNMARARIGNMARREVAASTTQELGEGAGIRITASNNHAEDTGLANKVRANTAYLKDPNRRSVSADAGFTLPDESRLGFEASYSDVTERLAAANLLFDGRIKTGSIKGTYTVETDIGLVNAMAYYTDVAMPWIQSQAVGGIHVDDRNAAVQVSDLFKIGGDDSFRVGVDGKRNRILAPGGINGTLSSNLWAGSAMWEHAFSPALTMINALRYDYLQLSRDGLSEIRDIYSNTAFDRADLGTSANSSLVASLTDDDKLRLSASRGLKMPSLSNLGQMERYLASRSPLYTYGNPSLRATAVFGYQMGWDHKINALGAETRVTAFHDMTMSHIGTTLSQFNNRLMLVSAATPGSVTNGLELEITRKQRNGWNWGANYTYQRLHEHMDQGLRDASPTNKLNGNIGYSFGDWEADLAASYTSATKAVIIKSIVPPVTTTVPLKGYTTVAPRLAWRGIDGVSVELSAENLWPYQDMAVQRMGVAYFLTLTVTY